MKGAAAEIFIDLFSSVLFISLPSLLPSPCRHTDPETPTAPQDVRRWQRGLKIHNMKPLLSICCTRWLYLCKQNRRHEGGMKANVRTTASAAARTDATQIES